MVKEYKDEEFEKYIAKTLFFDLKNKITELVEEEKEKLKNDDVLKKSGVMMFKSIAVDIDEIMYVLF